MTKKIFLILILIFIAGCLNSSVSEFKKGYAEIKGIDEKYGFELNSYPLDFTKINLTTPTDMETATLMQRDLNELKGKFESQENKNDALITYLNFRINLLNVDINYKLKLSGGSIGDVKDGFGCKHKPYILESATYENMSAQFGYAAINDLKKFLENHPKEAKIAEVSGAWPSLLNVSFQQIEKDARFAKSIVNKAC